MQIAGKTGTAQNGPDKSNRTLWFICFAPAANPKVAVGVIIKRGGVGATRPPRSRSRLSRRTWGSIDRRPRRRTGGAAADAL